ncbi:MAG: hypothetical protein ACK4YP_18870 [Myxococcota bacterium]
MRASAVFLLVFAAVTAACNPDCPGGTECVIGPSCYDACEKLFGDGDGQCNIVVPGKDGASGRAEMTSSCIAHCESAMNRAGEIGDYAPNERAPGGEDISLDNEQQAALWMDCVSETSCDNLNKNYCAPVTNFP